MQSIHALLKKSAYGQFYSRELKIDEAISNLKPREQEKVKNYLESNFISKKISRGIARFYIDSLSVDIEKVEHQFELMDSLLSLWNELESIRHDSDKSMNKLSRVLKEYKQFFPIDNVKYTNIIEKLHALIESDKNNPEAFIIEQNFRFQIALAFINKLPKYASEPQLKVVLKEISEMIALYQKNKVSSYASLDKDMLKHSNLVKDIESGHGKRFLGNWTKNNEYWENRSKAYKIQHETFDNSLKGIQNEMATTISKLEAEPVKQSRLRRRK